MKCDLHIHSVLSDGSLSIEDIVFYSAKIGLDYIAITDHDTLAGVDLAKKTGNSIGINVIPAVEISTFDPIRKRPVHMLCYLPKNIELLQKFLNSTLENRTHQKQEMIKKIMLLYPVTIEHIERYSRKSESIYESHIMQALADLGYTNTAIGSLMEALISSKGSCYYPSTYPDIYAVLDVIRNAGGIAIMAHPGQFNSLELLDELAREKKIDGAELNHPRNSEKIKKSIQRIAQNYALITTGGSDFHGQYAKEPHPLGSYVAPQNTIEALYRLSSEKLINK